MSVPFVRALSLSTRLLVAACGAALASSASLLIPGCLARCPEFEARFELIREPSPTQATLRAVVDFEGRGIAVGDGGVVLTRAGGDAWVARASGTTVDLHALVQARGGDIVLATGAGGTVLRGSADGSSWEVVDTGVEAVLQGVALDDAGLAVAVGDDVVLRSDDGGVTWVPATIPPGTTGLRAVAVNSESEWLAVGDGGAALLSRDGGLTWEPVNMPITADLRAVAGSFGVIGPRWAVVAADGTVLSGEIGAMEAVEVGEPGEMHAVSPYGNWMVGADGAVWKVLDGFVIRVALDPEGSRLLAVGGLGDTVVAVGEGGTILRARHVVEQVGSSLCRTDVIEGRPFVVDGAARIAGPVGRDDWYDEAAVAALPPATRARLAAAWTRDGLYEHASIASFARFVQHLLAVGAPAELVAAGQAALADEIRHARACFGLASAYAEAPVGPGPLAIEGSLDGPCDLATLAAATAVEGCVNETIAALIASTAAEMAEDPAVRVRLTAIAADERRHAVLAWRTLAWALERGGAEVRAAVAPAFATDPTPDDDTGEDGLAAHGRLSRRERAAVARVAWRDVIAPQAMALLGGSPRATLGTSAHA